MSLMISSIKQSKVPCGGTAVDDFGIRQNEVITQGVGKLQPRATPWVEVSLKGFEKSANTFSVRVNILGTP